MRQRPRRLQQSEGIKPEDERRKEYQGKKKAERRSGPPVRVCPLSLFFSPCRYTAQERDRRTSTDHQLGRPRNAEEKRQTLLSLGLCLRLSICLRVTGSSDGCFSRCVHQTYPHFKTHLLPHLLQVEAKSEQERHIELECTDSPTLSNLTLFKERENEISSLFSLSYHGDSSLSFFPFLNLCNLEYTLCPLSCSSSSSSFAGSPNSSSRERER